MADEKSKDLIAKSLDSPVKALLLPVASEVGDFFSDFLYHLTGNVHLSAEKKRAQHAHDEAGASPHRLQILPTGKRGKE